MLANLRNFLSTQLAAGSSPEPDVSFHLRMVWVGTGVAWASIGTLAFSLLTRRFQPGESGHEVAVALLSIAAILNLCAYITPWEKLIARYGAASIFRVWSLALFVFCALIVRFSPWPDSQMYLVYFPALLFAVVTLDHFSRLSLTVVGLASYLIVVLPAGGLPPGEVLLRLVSFGSVAFLGTFLTFQRRQTAIENARLYGESKRVGEDLRRVFGRFGKALASSLDLDRTLHLITDLTVEILDTDAAILILPSGDEGVRAPSAASGIHQVAFRRLHDEAAVWLTETTIHRRAPLHLHDLRSDERFARIGSREGVIFRSYLAVPLTLRRRVIGLLAVGRTKEGGFAPEAIDLLLSFANHAAIAIENARLFEAHQERLRELSGLHEISLAFASLTKLEDTYGQLVQHIARLIDSDRCVILLPDQTGDFLVAQEPACGLAVEQVKTMRIPVADESANARVWLTAQPYVTNDAQADPRNLHRWARAFGDRCMVIVPMRVEGKTVGLLRASNKRSGQFTNDDVRLLSIFATQAAVVLRNAMLFSDVADQRARLQAIFDHASDGIMMFDREGTVLAFNQVMATITGWLPLEAIGRNWREVCPTIDGDNVALGNALGMGDQGAGPRSSSNVEMAIRTRDGARRDVGVSYSFLDSRGDGVHGLAIIRDITKAKELDRAKSQFISTVSHELRTPLASIKASIGLLLTSMPGSTPEPLIRLLHNISRSTRRLESLVSDLLDLTRLESGRVTLHRRRLDLRSVVGAATATIRPLVDESEQELELQMPSEPCFASADRQRLEQVLLNLLSNANKYNSKGGKITVTVGRPSSYFKDQGDWEGALAASRPVDAGQAWWIAVADTGFGIPAKEHEHIFERFYRIDDGDTQRSTGTGLGLPIAKAIVELHGGRIWLCSEIGKGSSFYFSLPEGGADEDTGG